MRRDYDWPAVVAYARRRPERWCTGTALQNAPARTVARVRGRNHPALHLDDGVMEARITNVYTDDMGMDRGDIWVRFVPHDRVTSPHRGATKEDTREEHQAVDGR